MHVTNRKHLPWVIFVCAATVAASAIYVGNFHPNRMPGSTRLPPSLLQIPSEHRSVGGTPIGLIFGSISFGIFIFAGLLSLRKKLPVWRVGAVQRWLRAHIWLTLLTIPLVILHSGFRLGGPMTTLLMILYAIVMASGIYGLVLQHYLPNMMKDRLPAETVFEQIPHIRMQLCLAAEKMRDSFARDISKTTLSGIPTARLQSGPGAVAVSRSTVPAGDQPSPNPVTLTVTPTAISARKPVASPIVEQPLQITAKVIAPAEPTLAGTPSDPHSEEVLAEFIDDQVLPYLTARRRGRFRLGRKRYSDDAFRLLQMRVAESYRARVEEIHAWCDERRTLDLQTRLQHWLHGWLFVHVPISFLLLMLTAWHAVVTLFYY